MTNTTTTPAKPALPVRIDPVTARAAYVEKVRWLDCDACRKQAEHMVDGLPLCLRCLLADADPQVVAFGGSLVAGSAVPQ